MTEKELKKLNRYQLLELLVMQTERADALQTKVEELELQLGEKELRMARLGSVAEAAVQVSGLLEAAQKTADLYLEEARKQGDQIVMRARCEADAILLLARDQAADSSAGADK